LIDYFITVIATIPFSVVTFGYFKCNGRPTIWAKFYNHNIKF